MPACSRPEPLQVPHPRLRRCATELIDPHHAAHRHNVAQGKTVHRMLSVHTGPLETPKPWAGQAVQVKGLAGVEATTGARRRIRIDAAGHGSAPLPKLGGAIELRKQPPGSRYVRSG